MANTHVVLRTFTGTNKTLAGKISKDRKLDSSQIEKRYLDMLVKAKFVGLIGSKADAQTSLKALEETGAKSIGALDPNDVTALDAAIEEVLGEGVDDILEDDETEEVVKPGDQVFPNDLMVDAKDGVGRDEGPDGGIVKQVIISDTPITDAINAAADKPALKALAATHKSDVRLNLSYDNMKRELLAEFEGK